MQLYTSLVRLKQAMNGGALPPMTPVPESVHHLIDPAFVPGLGALAEDPEKGLRCPVRGCGEWLQSLGQHAAWKHKDIGGANGIRDALSIPRTAPLVSQTTRSRLVAANARQAAEGKRRTLQGQPEHLRSSRSRAKRTAANRAAKNTVGFLNLLDSCEAQTANKLIDLQNSLGRSPSKKDAVTVLGPYLIHRIVRVFGSWNSAKAQLGLEVMQRYRRYTVDEVLAMLQAYYDVHGRLPSAHAVSRRRTDPVLPRRKPMMRALDEPTWYDCMRKAARMLGIRDGRYGLQPFEQPSEAAD